MTPSHPIRHSTEPSPWRLAALVGLATQPLWDLLGRHPEFLIAHQARPWHVWVLAGLLGVVLPLGVALPFLWLRRRRPRVARWSIAAGTAAGGAIIALPWLKKAPGWPALGVLAAALLCGILLLWLERRAESVRQLLSLLAVSGPCLALFFLFGSPARSLLDQRAPELRPLPGAEAAKPIPIVVLVLDELPVASLMAPDASIDGGLWPNFARLAAMSTFYPNATTVASDTTFAVPAILGGRRPDRHRLPTAKDYPDTLLSYLPRLGYRVVGDEAASQLCTPPLCERPAAASGLSWRALTSDLLVIVRRLSLPDAWLQGVPAIDATWRDFAKPGARHGTARDPVSAFEAWLATIDGGERVGYFLHVNLPHVPWRYLPSGLEYGPIGMSVTPTGATTRWNQETWAVAQAWQRHLLQTAFADRLLGRLLDRLAEQDLLDDAAVVVVADHGAAFQPGQLRRRVVEETIGEIAAIPLLIKVPGQRSAAVDPRAAETVDILPTLAALIGVAPDFAVDGSSLLEERAPERPLRKVWRSNAEQLGDALPFATDQLVLQRQDAIARRRALFPSGDLFDLQASRSSLGHSLPAVESDAWQVEVEQPEQFADVDPSTGFVPAQMRFFLHRGAQEPQAGLPIGIALNGRMAATTRTLTESGGRIVAAAMVPEASFRPGANAVAAVALAEDGTPLGTLRTLDAPSYSLSAGGGEVVSDGRRWQVRQGQIAAHALLRRNPLGSSLDGYAYSAENVAVSRVLLFEGERCMLSMVPDSSLYLGASSERPAGSFFFRLPESMARNEQRLRLIGLMADGAHEIPIVTAR